VASIFVYPNSCTVIPQVGLATVQLGVAHGLKVLGTAGTPEGLKLVTSQGAAAVFNHSEPGYTDKILVL